MIEHAINLCSVHPVKTASLYVRRVFLSALCNVVALEHFGHARIQRGGPGVRTPPPLEFEKYYLKKGNFGIFFFFGGGGGPRL